MGYFRVRIPRLACASSPIYVSFCPIPTIMFCWRGRPTMDGNTARGASSPAKPALHIPLPLSITRAETSSSHIIVVDIGISREVSVVETMIVNCFAELYIQYADG